MSDVFKTLKKIEMITKERILYTPKRMNNNSGRVKYNNHLYSLEKLIAFAEKRPTQNVQTSSLVWLLDENPSLKAENSRIDKENESPIVVTYSVRNSRMVVLHGLEELRKARASNLSILTCKVVAESELTPFMIEKSV